MTKFHAFRRRFVHLSILISLSCLSGCGGGASSSTSQLDSSSLPQTSPITPGVWAALGSSTAAGSGASAGSSWVAKLAIQHQSAGVQIHNLAKGGLVTYQALTTGAIPPSGRPAPDPTVNVSAALSLRPTLLLLSFPSNDTLVGYGTEETINNLLNMRSVAQAQGVSVVVISSQPRNDLTPDARLRLQDIDARLSSAVGPCWVDVRQALSDQQGGLASAYSADGVHPNDAGHQLIFDAVNNVLNSGRCVRLLP